METHQELGNRLDLFFIDVTSPGSIFWKPRGALLFNNLIKIMRDLYDRYGYTEVVSPNIYNKKLWETSGHWEKYRENMFLLESSKTSVAPCDPNITIGSPAADVANIADTNITTDATTNAITDVPNEDHMYSLKPMNCVSGDAIVSLSNCTSVRLDQLDATGSDVLGYDGSIKGIVSTTKHEFMNKGVKKCLELTFLDDRKLVVTPDHQILTSSGWKQAKHLIVDEDFVLIGPIPPIVSNKFNPDWMLTYRFKEKLFKFTMHDQQSYDTSLALARICGVIFATGSIVKKKNTHKENTHKIGIEFTRTNDSTMIRDLNLIFGVDSPGIDICGEDGTTKTIGVIDMLAHFCSYGENNDENNDEINNDVMLPNIFASSDIGEIPIDFLRQFLSGVFGRTRDHPSLTSEYFTEVIMWSVSKGPCIEVLKKRAEQFKQLIIRAGVTDCVCSVPESHIDDDYHFRLRILIHVNSIDAFTKYIGFAHNYHNSQKLAIINSYYSSNCRNTHSPSEFLEEIGATEYFYTDSNRINIDTDTIVKTIPTFKLRLTGIKSFHNTNNTNNTSNTSNTSVYDISVDTDVQSFLANGIIVHNCPGHCIIFKNMRPFSKDLPIRMAEFGVLHRNESSGSLHGLTRVRRFQQDDAHIFCRMDQIHQEVLNTLRMVDQVYGLFGLTFVMHLSTRPEKYIGTVEIWDNAEKILENVMKEFTGKNKIKKNIGDGAFYGPKIDITLVDAYKRNVQCGTVQLDFNLPSSERFDLNYTDETDQSQHHHPVIVHRAVLGSVERFIGIILEHTQGRLPIQVTPYPIIIVTVHKDFNPSAEILKDHIHTMIRKRNIKLIVDADLSAADIRLKIKSAEKKGYCYIVTIGERETTAITQAIDVAEIAVRINKKIVPYTVDKLLDELENGLKLV